MRGRRLSKWAWLRKKGWATRPEAATRNVFHLLHSFMFSALPRSQTLFLNCRAVGSHASSLLQSKSTLPCMVWVKDCRSVLLPYLTIASGAMLSAKLDRDSIAVEARTRRVRRERSTARSTQSPPNSKMDSSGMVSVPSEKANIHLLWTE